MVSRYVVDGILIVGLLVGTLGVFYLSNGLFGKGSNRILQGLLVVLPVATYWAIAVYVTLQQPRVMSSLPLPDTFFSRLLVSAIASVGVVLVCSMLYRDVDHPESWHWKRLANPLIYPAALISVLSVVFSVVDFHFDALQTVAFSLGTGLLFYAGGIALSFLTYSLVSGASRLSDRQLQFIGLILTLLGIGTQFVPPVLDLLNIKVV